MSIADREKLKKSIADRLSDEDNNKAGSGKSQPLLDASAILDYGDNLSKLLQNIDIFTSLHAKYKNMSSGYIFEFHQAYLRFEDKIFLDVFAMEFCTFDEITNKFKKEFSILYADNSAIWDGTIFSETNPTVSEYFKIKDNMVSSDMFNREVLNLWMRKYFNEIIDEPRFYV